MRFFEPFLHHNRKAGDIKLLRITSELWAKDKRKREYTIVVLVLYILYILSGNFSRLIKNPIIPRSISTIEICIVLFVGIYIVREIFMLVRYRKLFESLKLKNITALEILLALILLSILVNMISYRFSFLPLMYYARFVSLCYFSFLVYLSLNFYKNINNVELFYKNIGIILCLIGWVIYFIQPDTEKLNNFFKSKGIYLNLDPHKFRLIGNVFDPNFFGNILVIFISIVFISLLVNHFNSKKDIILRFIILIFFEITLLKTISRSSILGLFILVTVNSIIIGIWSLSKKDIKTLKRLIFIDCILLFTIIIDKDFYRVFDRIKGITTDASAQARFQSWNNAVYYMQVNILKCLIGDGYGFLNIKYGLQFIGFDSSFLNLILYCGFLGTAVFLIWFFREIFFTFKNAKCADAKFKLFFINFCSLLLSFFIISWFNNLLFYQFWLVLFLPYYYFIIYQVKEGKR